MPYTKQTWVNGPGGGTKINATRMSYIETGIQTAQATAESAAGSVVGASGTVPVSNGTVDVYTSLNSSHVPTVAFALTAGGAHTFVAGNAGYMLGSLTSDNAPMTWTIPANATVAFPTGTAIKCLQRGTGQITIAGASGVALNAFASAYKTAGQNAAVTLTKLFTDTWLVEGGVN